MSALLFAGVLTGRPLLKYLLEAAYDGLSDRGWMLLTRNWAWWFAALAVANEIMRASLSFDAWLTAATPWFLLWRVLLYSVGATLSLAHWRPRLRAAQRNQADGDARQRIR